MANRFHLLVIAIAVAIVALQAIVINRDEGQWSRLGGTTRVAACYRCWSTGWLEPLLEADLAESRVAGRNQRTLAEFGPEIPRVRVNDNLAGVVARAEALTDQFIETELLGTGHFNRAIHWRAHGDPADRLGDVVSRHGLNDTGGSRTVVPSVASSAMRLTNSKNCVA